MTKIKEFICLPLRKKHIVDTGPKLKNGAKAGEYRRTLWLSSQDTP